MNARSPEPLMASVEPDGDDAVDRHVLQFAIESSPSAMLIVEPGGTIALVNREVERQFGYGRGELIGTPVDRLLPQTLRLLHTTAADHVASGAPVRQSRPSRAMCEQSARRKDGTDTRVDTCRFPIWTDRGLFVVVSIVPLTERSSALADVTRLRDQSHAEHVHRNREVERTFAISGVVGQGAAIRRVYEQVRQVAETDATVLLLGETGSGKELFASQIHTLSRRSGRAMVRVNCSAIPVTLLESELFGREKGAYTGADSRQMGRFEIADASTIFLDEIGDLPPEVQVKLLRVLDNKQIERLGSSKTTTVDTRIIAATHRDLEKGIEAETFREDLYYRLNVFPIRVPPLRERTEDIPLLVWHFVEDFSRALGKRIESIAKDNIEMLQRYAWPGNVRELRNVVERSMIVATGPHLTIALPQCSAVSTRRSVKLADLEKEHIKGVLDSTAWRIRGVGGAADWLGLKATTLESRMAKLGLQRPRP